MYADFFKSDRPRPNNPTYTSASYQSTLFLPRNDHHMSYSQPRLPALTSNYSSSLLLTGNTANTRKYSSSSLSNYGSSSLSKLPVNSSKQVFERQQRNYNILNLSQIHHKQSLGQFPKLRNERKEDISHKIRQAFIDGKPEIALSKRLNPQK